MKSPLSLQPRNHRRSRPLCTGALCSVLGAFASNAGMAFADVPDAGALDAAVPDAGAPDAASPDAAAPVTTFPERPAGVFPSCASEQDTFCIESATKDESDILGSSYFIGASFLDANSINWSIGAGSQYGELPAEDLGSTFHFVIRTGDMQPLYTYAIADQFHLTAGGDGQSGYHISIEATPTTIHWNFEEGFSCTTLECGDDQTQATSVASGRRLSGNTQNMALWAEDERNRFGGTYVASNAQALSTVVLFEAYPTPRWYIDVANPHLDTEGNPVTGSFTAWVPPSYFEGLGTTASAALETGFDVTRTEGGVGEPLAATITLDQGGTLVRIDSVSYSAPRITVAQSTGGEGGGSDPNPGASGSGGNGSGGTGSAGTGSVGEGASGSASGGTGSGGTGSVDEGSGGTGSVDEGSGGTGSGGSGTSAAGATGNAGSGNVVTSTAGAGGSSASPTPDVTAGSGGGLASPSSDRKPRSSGCALGAPSTDPVAALAAGGLLALLYTRRRTSSARRR